MTRGSMTAAALLVALGWASAARAAGDDAPEGDAERDEGEAWIARGDAAGPNRALLATAAGVFAVSYGASVAVASMSDRDADRRLFMPVIGPWLALEQRDCAAVPCGDNEDLDRALVVTGGLLQGAAALLALSSLWIPEPASALRASRAVHVGPLSFGRGAGLGAYGVF